MLGDSSTEKVLYSINEQVTCDAKAILLSLGGLEVHMTAEFSKKSFCQNVYIHHGHNIVGRGTRYEFN